MLYTCILFASKFDIQIPPDSIKLGQKNYGLGTQEPENKIPYRIRTRET